MILLIGSETVHHRLMMSVSALSYHTEEVIDLLFTEYIYAFKISNLPYQPLNIFVCIFNPTK